MKTIKVYFESKTHSELVATFESEKLYMACLPNIKKEAKKGGMFVTESLEEESSLKLPIYWSVEDFEIKAESNFNELKENEPKEVENLENWEQLYDKTKFPKALEDMIYRHDAEFGVTWLTLEFYLADCEIKN